jgi:hypothetical protein
MHWLIPSVSGDIDVPTSWWDTVANLQQVHAQLQAARARIAELTEGSGS